MFVFIIISQQFLQITFSPEKQRFNRGDAQLHNLRYLQVTQSFNFIQCKGNFLIFGKFINGLKEYGGPFFVLQLNPRVYKSGLFYKRFIAFFPEKALNKGKSLLPLPCSQQVQRFGYGNAI